jgi:hypothetical protein
MDPHGRINLIIGRIFWSWASPRQPLAKRKKAKKQQGLGCPRHPRDHWLANWVLPSSPDLYYYKGVHFFLLLICRKKLNKRKKQDL